MNKTGIKKILTTALIVVGTMAVVNRVQAAKRIVNPASV